MSCACLPKHHSLIFDDLLHAPVQSLRRRSGILQAASRVVRRWCITGTPLNRGLDDLYGLFYFLHANPYSERHFWKHVLQEPYMAGCPAGTQAFAAHPRVSTCKSLLCLFLLRPLSSSASACVCRALTDQKPGGLLIEW